MANVFDVANFFIQVANQSEDDQMTNLKLNKLLYYAQGAFLARTGRPLFDNPIEAWPLGPVVSDIYHKYKVCGRNPIASDDGEFDYSKFSEEEMDVLLDVMREFGKYTGSALVSMTHRQGTPWSDTRERGESVLSNADMRDYFNSHPVPAFCDTVCAPRVSVLPSDWYAPEEDAVWEAYL